MSRLRRVKMESEWTTTLIFGDSKVGKTTLSGTAPKPIILNRDNGTSSLLYDDRFEPVRVIDIRSNADYEVSWDNLAGVGAKDWTRFRSNVHDDLGSIQQMIQDELMQLVVERDPRRQMDDPGRKEYGILGNRLRRWVRKYKDLPQHKIFICGQFYDEELEQFRPSLIGAMRNQIAHYCDTIGYLRVSKKDGETRYLHLRSKGRIYAETRFWWLPPRIKNPNLTTLFNMITAGPAEEVQG